MAATKFLFNTDFGSAGRPPEEAKVSAAAHETALAAAEARGHASGLNAAEARERTDAERRRAAAFERIGGVFQELVKTISAVETKLEAEAVEVAFAVARKLCAELTAREPMAEIAALTRSCLAELRTAPHVVIRVNDRLHSAASAELTEIARSSGYEGKLVVFGEAEIAPGDCRIEWADGGMVREQKFAEAAVADAVARYVAARNGPPQPKFGD